MRSQSTDAAALAPFSAAEVIRLLRWHRSRGRSFPWRSDTDPYRLVVTELMLVRTRADQVAALWPIFFGRYPNLESLADALPDEIRDALKPLGLTWRAEKVIAFGHAAAADARWTEDLDKVPGGGPYVTSSVRLSWRGRGFLPVDVTIARVIARYWGLRGPGERRRDPRVHMAAASLGPRSRRFFHAWLDLAALVCLPKEPRCQACPLRSCLSKRRRA
jgi:A/G-specific adenine glycosylase